jgi:intracellular multiplication protein IcmN
MEDSTDASLQDRYEKLSSDKVTVISIGDSYMISIPSLRLFYKESPKMKWSCYDLLDDVIAYLQSYRKIIVKVTAYSEYCQSKSRTTALTEERAKVLGKYLWSQDIGTGMVFTAGAGNDKPITSLRKVCSDTSPNSRIEIVFRQITA